MFLQIVTTVMFVAICYVLLKYIIHIATLQRYPSGPFPLPIIGNLHLLTNGRIWECLAEIAKHHGKVFSVSVGMVRVVVVTSIHPAREALVKKGKDFMNRSLHR